MKCLYCKKETKRLKEKSLEEKMKELARIKELENFAGHDIISELKIKKIIEDLRELYCEYCAYDQLSQMNAEHVRVRLGQKDL